MYITKRGKPIGMFMSFEGHEKFRRNAHVQKVTDLISEADG